MLAATASRVVPRWYRVRPFQHGVNAPPTLSNKLCSLRYSSGLGTDDDSDSSGAATATSTLYLHVGPSGDCWTGQSIFAAKHLQPDYVKSVRLDPDEISCVDTLVDMLEENDTWTRQIYDNESFPTDLLEALQKAAATTTINSGTNHDEEECD